MKNENSRYLEETAILNYSASEIQKLIKQRGWNDLDEYQKIKGIYNFVRDEILFGYNQSDLITALHVLRDGMGQCNTKATLLMALLRGVGVPCRLHGFTVYKSVQKGATSGFVTKYTPDEVIHTWVEVLFEDNWYVLEGVILDQKYLKGLQEKFKNESGAFCGYGVCTDNFQEPQVDWERNDTYIQKSGIGQDFGVYDSPDEFVKQHRQPLSPMKNFLYMHLGRHIMNHNVKKIRNTRR